MNKFILSIFLVNSALFAGVKVVAPTGLPALSLTKLINENKNSEIEYKIEKNADALVVDMLKRNGDIAIVPSNFAATLYNKNLNYKILGTVGWGSFYIISDSQLNSLKDLKGKEIYAMGKGLTPDIVLRTVLMKNGIDPDKDLTINYLSTPNEVAGFYMSNKAKIIVLPEPALSKVMNKKPNTKINFNLNNLWKNVTKSKLGYPQSTLIVKNELLNNNPKFVNEFVKDMKSSVDFLYSDNVNKDEYIKNMNIKISPKDLPSILDRGNLRFVEIKDCTKEYGEYFKIIENLNPKVIGGKIPNNEIFKVK